MPSGTRLQSVWVGSLHIRVRDPGSLEQRCFTVHYICSPRLREPAALSGPRGGPETPPHTIWNRVGASNRVPRPLLGASGRNDWLQFPRDRSAPADPATGHLCAESTASRSASDGELLKGVLFSPSWATAVLPVPTVRLSGLLAYRCRTLYSIRASLQTDPRGASSETPGRP